jgi:hypothetical protein
VPGERVVLPLTDLPAVGAAPRRYGPPLVDDGHAFWLARLSTTETVAFRALWSDRVGRLCPVTWHDMLDNRPLRFFSASCNGSGSFTFNDRGEAGPGAPRGLDRYLVSVTEDRVIVNVSRLIVTPERTSAPPTP